MEGVFVTRYEGEDDTETPGVVVIVVGLESDVDSTILFSTLEWYGCVLHFEKKCCCIFLWLYLCKPPSNVQLLLCPFCSVTASPRPVLKTFKLIFCFAIINFEKKGGILYKNLTFREQIFG